MKQRIVITGVAGFVGSNLADKLLQEGFEVVGIDNLSYGLKTQIPEGVEFHQLDIRSKDIYPIFKTDDVVFHLAAKNSLPDCEKDPVETTEINVFGTVNVFEAARRAGVKKVVYAESSAIYEERALGFYALSKKCTNLFAQGFQRKGLKTVGLRYFNIYGPRQDYRRSTPPVMSTLIIRLLKGEPVTVFEGDELNKRDFIHVDDVNSFHVLCIKDERVDNRVFDLGNGKNHSILEIYETIKDLVPEKVSSITKPRLSDDPPVTTLADIKEATSLGWSPKIDIKDGLSHMVEFIGREIAKGNIK